MTLPKTAKEWGCVSELPKVTAPKVKYKKRSWWGKEELQFAYGQIDGELLHLIFHMAFICSTRPGEVLGVELTSINLDEGFIEIRQEIARVSKKALAEVPKEDVYRVFPQMVKTSKSFLIEKAVKNDKSNRRIYINKYLIAAIKKRIEKINYLKGAFGESYNDYNLLICHNNGNPVETTVAQRWLRAWQTENGVKNKITMHSLRKSSIMYKLRLTGNDYMTVTGDSGHTQTQNPVVDAHYNEVLEHERKKLAKMVEDDFYPESQKPKAILNLATVDPNVINLLKEVSASPTLLSQLEQFLQVQR